MDAGRVLRAVDIAGPMMVAKGSRTMPQGAGKLFVGNGVAYASAASNQFGGYATANVANPNSLTLIAGSAATSGSASPNPYVVANGSGLGVMTVGGGFGINPSLNVYNVTNPAQTNQFLTSYPLPQAPRDVALADGIAYVADGSAGLLVVNDRAFDNLGVSPAVTADAASADTDPGTPGVQGVEGTVAAVKATVSDDVQVRDLELLVDGVVVRNDVSFPFDLTAFLPSLASRPAGVTTVTVEARATDTGGNVATSAPIMLNLVRDTVRPMVMS